jgi:hypothetical protein
MVDAADIELSLTLQAPEGATAESLSTAFYEHFEGVIAAQDGQIQVAVLLQGRDPLAISMDAVIRLETALTGTVVKSADPDLVDITEIAERMNVTRANAHQLATGQRGSGFPEPIGRPSGHRIWAWGSVNEWIRTHRPSSWQGTRTLSTNDYRRLDGWLAERPAPVMLLETGDTAGRCVQIASRMVARGPSGAVMITPMPSSGANRAPGVAAC